MQGAPYKLTEVKALLSGLHLPQRRNPTGGVTCQF